MEKQTKPSVKEIVTYLKLLGSHTTRSFVGLVLLYVIGAFLETFSITLILPLVTVFLDPENKTGKMASFVNGIFGDTPLVVLVVMIFLAFLLKNVYLYVLDIVKRKFVIVNYRKTSEKLFALYLNKPYEFYTKVNSATLINNINVYTGKIFVYLQTVVNLISELIVMIVLIIAMCFINWMVALYAIISFSLVTFILKKVLYGRMKAIGVKSNKSFDHMLMSVSQAIAGIKETKTYKVEKDVLDEYNEHLKINADMEVKYTAISAVSSRLIEMVTITGMLIILLVTYVKGLDSTSLIAQLAVFAVVLVRMMPGMSRINVYLSHMNNQHATLERSDGDFKESIKLISKTEDVKADTREKINIDFDKICLDNIYFRYDEDRMILDDINMTINRGDTIGLKGASGEGKTTLLNLLLGLLKPTNGSITFKKGDDAVIENAMIGSLNVGYIPQDVFIFDGTIAENITFFRKYDKEKMAKAIKLAHMEELMEQLEKGENTRIGERGIRLSGGQNQRIGIARALYDNPDVLILDEATSALDNNLENQIMNDIYELKGIKTIIIAAHRLSTLAYCDRVYDIKKGHAVLCDEKFS